MPFEEDHVVGGGVRGPFGVELSQPACACAFDPGDLAQLAALNDEQHLQEELRIERE